MDYYQPGAIKDTFSYRDTNIVPSVVNGLNVSFWCYFVIKAFSYMLLWVFKLLEITIRNENAIKSQQEIIMRLLIYLYVPLVIVNVQFRCLFE